MKRAAALILAVCMLALAACGTEPAPETSAAAGGNTSITIGETMVIPDYDPANWYISTQSTLFSNVYSTLIDVISSSSSVRTSPRAGRRKRTAWYGCST